MSAEGKDMGHGDPNYHLYLGIRNRDERSLHEALEHFVRPVMAIMWRRIHYCGPHEDLKDLFQEVAIRIWTRIDLYDPARTGTTFSKWVNQIARSVAGEYARKYHRRRRLAEHAAEAIYHPWPSSPEDEWIDHISGERRRVDLAKAIAVLSREDRRVTTLFLEGRSYSEMAIILRTSPGAIRTRMTRVRTKLAEVLQNNMVEPLEAPEPERT